MDLVDLELYPLTDLAGQAATEMLRNARDQVASTGYAELPGFVNAKGVAALAHDAESIKQRAHQSSGIGTAYLEAPDLQLDDRHPRRWRGRYSVGAVAYDLIPLDSTLRRLYEWEMLTELISAVLGRGTVYRYADPFGAVNLAVMGEGDELQWHFDQTDFVVSLAIQTADIGGDFEVAPLVRNGDDENYEDVSAVLVGEAGSTGLVKTIAMTPGTLLIFEGRNSLHRVSPISGPTLRHVGLLAYDTRPGTLGSDLLRMNRYGRTEPFDEPPVVWPVS